MLQSYNSWRIRSCKNKLLVKYFLNPWLRPVDVDTSPPPLTHADQRLLSATEFYQQFKSEITALNYNNHICDINQGGGGRVWCNVSNVIMIISLSVWFMISMISLSSKIHILVHVSSQCVISYQMNGL